MSHRKAKAQVELEIQQIDQLLETYEALLNKARNKE